jgi:tetratricopeptide (TPR) repeat protein
MDTSNFHIAQRNAAAPAGAGNGGELSAARVQQLVRAALAAAQDESTNPLERAQMLMEIAMGLQLRPKTPDHLRAAVALYDEALTLCPEEPLLTARVTARKATALQAIPEAGVGHIEEARDAIERALPSLVSFGTAQEAAEAEMNLGLVLQQLASAGRAPIAAAIRAYQGALRTFDAKRHPIEFAILQNNLATAFLSTPFTDERAKIREALAVQCFEDGLKVVNLIEHPSEYAMLQNNLGNALQYVASSHSVANNLRAIVAYDEALKVRTRATTPLEYANTIANKANCLWNLPDDPQRPADGNPRNLRTAKSFYEEAAEIFAAHGETQKRQIVADALAQLEHEILALERAS